MKNATSSFNNEDSVELPTMLYEALLRQAALDLDLSVERDIEVIRRRCKHEGLSFLTITLPSLSDSLERGLETGLLCISSSFRRYGALPHLLGGLFRRVFNKDGRLLHEPCPEAIDTLRGISRFFKKPKIPCSPDREIKAEGHFVEVESELRRGTSQIERKDYVLDTIAGIIWSRVFPETDYLDLVCHHGPGVTADHRGANERHELRSWNDRSEATFPSDLHCYPNYGYAAEAGKYGEGSSEVPGIVYLSLKEETPVRVVFVPKTQMAPRVIAIEPSHMQFMQQSFKDYMYKRIEEDSLTRNSVRFTRQEPNQSLAHRGSIDRRTATLDLKDASDRVHLHLVQRIFKTSGALQYLEDARSLHATLPSGKNLLLWKYASMGSALCFPVEACVFYTLIQSAMHIQDGIRPSSRSIRRFSRKIDVYGDDIVVPVEYTDSVVSYLESYLLKVNVSKSFKDGYFRESCGADFYKGIDVKPIYARTIPFDDRRRWGAAELISWNATADLFYLKGKWIVAQAIRDMLRRVVKQSIPRARNFGAGLFHLSLLFDTDLKFDKDLQGWRQKRYTFQPTKKKDEIDGHATPCLNKWGQSVARRQRRVGILGALPMRSFVFDEIYKDVGSVWNSVSQIRSPDVGGSLLPHDWDNCGLSRTQSVSGVSIPDDTTEAKASVISGLDDHNTGLVRLSPDHGCRGVDTKDRTVGLIVPRPLDYLMGRSQGLDFVASVRRGSLKSKCRWVTL